MTEQEAGRAAESAADDHSSRPVAATVRAAIELLKEARGPSVAETQLVKVLNDMSTALTQTVETSGENVKVLREFIGVLQSMGERITKLNTAVDAVRREGWRHI